MLEERILKLPEVVKIVNLKKSTIYKRMRENKFPHSVHLTEGGRSVGWKLSDIQKYLDNLRY